MLEKLIHPRQKPAARLTDQSISEINLQQTWVNVRKVSSYDKSSWIGLIHHRTSNKDYSSSILRNDGLWKICLQIAFRTVIHGLPQYEANLINNSKRISYGNIYGIHFTLPLELATTQLDEL